MNGWHGAGRLRIRLLAPIVASVAMFAASGVALAQDKPEAAKSAELGSLLTETPEAGFALAVKLSQKGVGTVQPDVAVRKGLRATYAHDPDSLIATSQVIAIHFQTIAAANDYWRK